MHFRWMPGCLDGRESMYRGFIFRAGLFPHLPLAPVARCVQRSSNELMSSAACIISRSSPLLHLWRRPGVVASSLARLFSRPEFAPLVGRLSDLRLPLYSPIGLAARFAKAGSTPPSSRHPPSAHDPPRSLHRGCTAKARLRQFLPDVLHGGSAPS